MKKKLFAAVAMLAMAATASAQFTNSSASATSGASSEISKGWGTIYVQWNPMTASVDIEGADDMDFTGFSLGFNKAFGISKSIPLYVEAGIGLTYAFYSDEETGEFYYDGYLMDGSIEQKINAFAAKVPVSLTYKWDIPNSSVSIMPFLGLTMRYVFSAKGTTTYTLSYGGESASEEEDYNFFDEDEVGKDGTWNHFQLGWQIGLNAKIGKSFLVGVSYGSDFSEIAEKTKLKTTSVTLGYCF